MLRAVDMQQVLLQTTAVSKMQQQGAHGAEVEGAKLAQQQLLKEEKQQRDIQEINQAGQSALDNNFHHDEDQSSGHAHRQDQPKGEKSSEKSPPSKSPHACRRTGGVYIDIKA